MKIGILGCGAMGTVMGAYMTKNGLDVELIDSYKEHVDVLNKNGAHIIGSVDMIVPVKAVTPEEMKGIYDLIFLFTKQTVNDTVLKNLLPHLNEKSTVCTLQNGVPEHFVAGYVGEERTLGGTVLWGATFVKPGVSELTQDITKNDHLFEIGAIDGTIGERVNNAAEILGYMGRAKITDTLMASRWGKLINNACMSGMSAACGATFGEILQDEKSRACLSYLAREVKRCCEAEGYKMPILLNEQLPYSCDIKDQEMFDTNQRMFLEMYKDMYTAKASMLQDLEKEKKTEVLMINGYVSSTGDKYNIDTPFNDTVVEIVTKIEKKLLPLSMDNLKYFNDKLFEYKYYQEKK
ncbi:ketopantoate reductase family protein [Fusobacterium ulcerans]|jgi:2-dehydropantoate 2-reductase|uniref:2-dehydropantoate 2-reductase n=2 Tax=Fusobacterium ulcerans TaxID=861 RepID=A0AAX2J9X7_9FUSO|nr:ketopantoate reductase family protein [Fusobacterium ulcerans]AVQ29082.1 ketopantoate reductase family protein [Fusobacterium ulcerans]EFS26550.1 2-dehydropantoate 2-reductase [Fusobacterium ulcerans ATCC 49185]EHO81805.1 2-dehydropantoate 2-reductase [Fusobacterium ulcerans 12-1B]SQJ02349.1 2-dehydropantoate 2-reductase [Fusobacterium ulcerans]